MNKRILEIAKQAGFGLHRDGEIYTSRLEHLPITEHIEKFAELIVKRCIQVCDGNHEYKNRTDTDFGKGVSVGIQMSKEQIKAHFGVEE